jgi:hypothetical protein
MDPVDDVLAFFAVGHEHDCAEVGSQEEQPDEFGSQDELPGDVGTIRASLHLSLAGTLAFSTAFVLPHRSFIHCVGSGPFSVPA